MLTYHETPFQEIYDEKLAQAGIRLVIKREDLNHPYVSGNKWWKLKYNLQEARLQNKTTIVTYGGAFSNHIYATAAAAQELNIKSIGIIRGEETIPLNATLSFATSRGMRLHYLSRVAYRSKETPVQNLQEFHDAYLIPEGGTNSLAVQGVQEFAKEIGTQFDYLCCPVGTGGTLAGLINAFGDEKKILGFCVLKGAQFLKEEVNKFIYPNARCNWQLIHDYHFGGYAKTTPALLQFIEDFMISHQVPLEFVYTGKMLAGVFDLISKGFFSRGATVLAIHTGGLQGAQFGAGVDGSTVEPTKRSDHRVHGT